MTDIALTVNKESVYEEVAQTTAYTGAKMDNELAYNRIFTTDEHRRYQGYHGQQAPPRLPDSRQRGKI